MLENQVLERTIASYHVTIHILHFARDYMFGPICLSLCPCVCLYALSQPSFWYVKVTRAQGQNFKFLGRVFIPYTDWWQVQNAGIFFSTDCGCPTKRKKRSTTNGTDGNLLIILHLCGNRNRNRNRKAVLTVSRESERWSCYKLVHSVVALEHLVC